MNKTSIQWTDFSANPLKYRAQDGRGVWACEKLSAGCANCYAESLSHRYGGTRRAGDWNAATMATLTPFLDETELHKMLTYKPASGKRVFVGDMTDIFGEWVPDALLDQLFAVFALCDGTRSGGRFVTFQVLTKRAERLRRYLSDPETPFRVHSEVVYRVIKGYRPHKGGCDWHPITPWPSPNVWIGVSVENQTRYDQRIGHLLRTPAAVRFLSYEPALGPLDLRMGGMSMPDYSDRNPLPNVDWLICGGESGKGARPFDVAWARSIVQQCQAAGVAVFVKQLGANVRDRNDAGFDGSGRNDIDGRCSWPEMEPDDIEESPDGYRDEYQGAPVRVHLRDSHGGDPAEWPEDLRVRQFPEGVA